MMNDRVTRFELTFAYHSVAHESELSNSVYVRVVSAVVIVINQIGTWELIHEVFFLLSYVDTCCSPLVPLRVLVDAEKYWRW